MGNTKEFYHFQIRPPEVSAFSSLIPRIRLKNEGPFVLLVNESLQFIQYI